MSSQYKFEIKRMVLVDSAGFCYVELPVDEHAILLADGNIGKSSILNSLRLFLLPENNFKNSKNKFAFSTPKNDGFYDNEESYHHYFPSKYSFLILEVSHQHAGTEYNHCQILHPSTGYLSYSRIFTPLAFDQIRHLFWQLDGDEDGIGYRANSLSSSEVFKQLKSLHKDTVSIKDTTKLKELLYANEQLVPQNMRYSVFPLAECDDARIESLRTLVLLLFEMNSGSGGVAKAVANIIEADKKFTSDILDFNIDQFLSKHDELKQQELELIKISNLENKYQGLQENFQQYSRFQMADKDFANFYISLNTQLSELKKHLQLAANVVSESSSELKDQQALVQSIKVSLKAEQIEENKLNTKYTRLTKALDKAQLLLAGYPDKPLHTVIEWFNDDIATMKEDLAAHQDRTASINRIAKLEASINQNESEQQRLITRINTQEFSLSNQLPKRTWQVYAAINKRLALANPGKNLTELQLAAFNQFAELFENKSDAVILFDEVFNQQSQQLNDDSKLRLTDVEADLKADRQSLQALRQSQNNSIANAGEIKRLTRDINLAEEELLTLKHLEHNNLSLEEVTQELEQVRRKTTELADEQGKASTTLSQLQQTAEQAKLNWQTIANQVNSLVQLQKQADSIKTRYPRCAQALEKSITSTRQFTLTTAELADIEAQLASLTELNLQLQKGLCNFVLEQIIVDKQGIMNEAPSFSVVRKTFEALSDVYTNLEARQTMLNEQIYVHNESVQSYMNLLQQNFDYIKDFETGLNRDFSQISINDLDGISVEIHIDKRFENLVQELQHVDLYAEQLISDNFYARLRAFANSGIFASKSSGSNVKAVSQRLTMDKIIENLSYKTRKRNQTQWQSKQQSNSTTALINLKLVQILLKRLRASGYDLLLPLVLDEVATVDVKQFDWLLDDIKSSGFTLFAASTHSASSQLIYKIGRYHEIGAMRTQKPYSKERTLVYWGGAELFTSLDESLLHDNDQSTESQLGLLAGIEAGQTDIFDLQNDDDQIADKQVNKSKVLENDITESQTITSEVKQGNEEA
ncbi:hypothetical protein Q4530_11570 [Colwellia sp. 1_MG-2023]|uniref:hypothetical protein n=1 Tax=unclassified Colwellia TaxID=196834 RepID=UPI001C099EDE|nr:MULTISPECIES: hypothetical protein [unclassified Colwellia]MBU2926009.1 hypothetical protein [Colwellia sp. C2M11]MDO6653149.1 hypothetical protein [Colwellia sp. 3_MG-2023]MDO6666098.1 hypothetical protein [Colwellia sp. 2_MG-2023]MDO6690416.1 hypothetical protein [Colwellia sp. 1_MG-2023]